MAAAYQRLPADAEEAAKLTANDARASAAEETASGLESDTAVPDEHEVLLSKDGEEQAAGWMYIVLMLMLQAKKALLRCCRVSATVSDAVSNTILGTGMLAMPHSVASCGIIPGILLIVLSGLMSFFGLWLLSRSASKARPARTASFAALADMTYPKAAFLFDAAIAIKCAGVATSYLIIIGGLMPKVVLSFDKHPPEWLLDRGLWIVVAMVILTPLCYLKTLNALRFTSYVALIAVFDLILVVVYKYFSRHPLPKDVDAHLFVFDTTIISSIPVYIFAFTCAQNLFSCFNEVKRNTQERMNIITGTSIGSAAIIYEIIGLLGYLTFGSKVPSNVMTAYHNSLFVNLCRAGIVVLVLFSYPLQILPCRNSLNHLWGGHSSPVRHILLTTFLLLVTFLIAINVHQLELVLGIIGSTGSTTISFLLPAAFYLKLFPKDEWKGVRALAKALLATGFAVMFVCLGVVIYHAITGK